METYISLEGPAVVYREEKYDVLARPEGFAKDIVVLFLCGPEALFRVAFPRSQQSQGT